MAEGKSGERECLFVFFCLFLVLLVFGSAGSRGIRGITGPQCHGVTGQERGASPPSLSSRGRHPRQLGLGEDLPGALPGGTHSLGARLLSGPVPAVPAAQAPPSGSSEGDQKAEDGAQEGEPPGHPRTPQRFQGDGQRSRKTANRPAFVSVVRAAEI